jgi:hypothetical protein
MVCNVGDKRNYKNLKGKQQICTAPTGIFEQKSNTRARSNGHCQSNQVFAGGKHSPILTHRRVLHLVRNQDDVPHWSQNSGNLFTSDGLPYFLVAEFFHRIRCCSRQWFNGHAALFAFLPVYLDAWTFPADGGRAVGVTDSGKALTLIGTL